MTISVMQQDDSEKGVNSEFWRIRVAMCSLVCATLCNMGRRRIFIALHVITVTAEIANWVCIGYDWISSQSVEVCVREIGEDTNSEQCR
jgi:hypothetical protein